MATVLVVDPSQGMRTIFKHLFEQKGCDVKTACSLEEMRKVIEATPGISVMVVDDSLVVEMADGGAAVKQEIRNAVPGIRIISFSDNGVNSFGDLTVIRSGEGSMPGLVETVLRFLPSAPR